MQHNSDSFHTKPDELPFIAPCKQLNLSDPLHWLQLGWQDFKSAPRQSLIYGLVATIVAYLIAWLGYQFGSLPFLLTLGAVVMFLGPVLAVGLYSISRQLQHGKVPVLGYCLKQGKRHLSNELVFAIMLMVVFLVWARAASVVHIFFPEQAGVGINDYAIYLLVGTSVGAIFSILVFAASAFSLPMFMDKKADTITAVLSSINAVLKNKRVLLLWALLILLGMMISMLTLFVALMVILPVIGYATWHGYRETIMAQQWPSHDDME
ncbi:MAG: DUF2189 domain-containing protein [Gammaproteobacteria bacterium]|nr:DUF2189 domain-containing protein [Gammaproteobacteria bacterium]